MRETDEIIIGNVLNGDRQAFALLVDNYKDRVFSLVVGIVRNREIAEELAQDVFVKAFSNLKKFRKEASFSTWIYRIAYNTAISETRKKNYKLKSYDEQLEKATAMNDFEVTESEDIAAQKQKLLKQAMEELVPEEKLILMLYYFEDRSIEEISHSTGLSNSNVKVKLFRLRNKLKELVLSLGKEQLPVY